jgi:hypothetical protein
MNWLGTNTTGISAPCEHGLSSTAKAAAITQTLLRISNN